MKQYGFGTWLKKVIGLWVALFGLAIIFGPSNPPFYTIAAWLILAAPFVAAAGVWRLNHPSTPPKQ